jgi:twinkle protein
MPDGLVFGHELWEDIINSPEPFCVETPIEGLNRLIYGLRLSEMVTFTADPKIGKTTVLKTIEYALIQNQELKDRKYGIGFMHLEEPKKDLAVGLMGLHVGKRLNLPDTPKTEEELRKAFDDVINTDRVVIWDHFGSNSVDAVVNKIRHMHALGCKYIVLDHFSMLASDQSDDERKKLDEIATRLKTLTVELDICLIGVIHQNRQGQIRGTAAFEQLSNIVIRLERDKLDKDPWRRNVMVLTVTENRFSGRTGPAAYLFFDDTTGQFQELDQEAAQKYEEGRSLNDADIPF